ncbi:MAG: flagellar protein FlgN [Phycisphaerales bacterium]
MSQAHPTPAPAHPLDHHAAELEKVLLQIADRYETLARCASDRREAMRRADARALANCIDTENQAVQALADLERRRMIVVEAIAAAIGSPDRSQTPVSRLAPALPEPARSRLLVLSASLRELMENVSRLNESARRAAEMLAAHMEGLMRHVAARLNHAQTYNPKGVVTCGPRIVTGLDSVG